ncbi:probable LRR receptor-like serine/threonine-protein kinase At3g47570 [Syzygium oleosum]|uniref:probable LRR receptor-like serine/threonine-protein kinase At3g47570 n=1 Tax=Syzygium oleosum TaxID=219896 RepID=UPI0024BB04A5|nr:probable LRR receptor-like serine/threonine-protein kinase At3g47570 [Syzygium oleosum]
MGFLLTISSLEKGFGGGIYGAIKFRAQGLRDHRFESVSLFDFWGFQIIGRCVFCAQYRCEPIEGLGGSLVGSRQSESDIVGIFGCFEAASFRWKDGRVIPHPVLVDAGGDETDQLALLEFKARIADPDGVLSLWNDSSHFCKWYGVTCGRRHRRVTVLDLPFKNLSGIMPSCIGNLSFLREVNLHNNNFHSEIPPQFGRLFRLQKLILYNNLFSGQIPLNLSRCSNLLVLNLGENNLKGNLPAELGSLSNLQQLIVEHNSLTGNIPPSLGNLSSLQRFSASFNNLGGTIPEILGQLRTLDILYLGANQFIGTIPISIFNISTMTSLDGAENQLEGGLPSDLGFTLPNLKEIGLYGNHLTGPIPESLCNASNLGQFEFARNNFTGKVPSCSKKTRLYWFNIGDNNLGSGQSDDLDFICSLTNSTNLEVLGIEKNAFGGPIPDCIGNLSITLSQFELSYNYIYGTLPSGIKNLINLEILSIEINNISGNIPSEIGNLNKLKVMYLGINNLSGQIPESIGNLRMLTKLGLNDNNLHGSIPSSLGNCQNLLLLDLSTNDLSGNIPPEIMGLSSLSIYLDLSQNNLTGSLPGEVGKLKNLGKLLLYGNRLSQQIPSSISSCISMEVLYMQDNFFEGPLPLTMRSMRGLQVLNVSNNQLVGQIPKYLESLNLTNLSLSYNDFEGALPTGGVFKSAISTSVVGNKKLCGGLPDFQLPKCDYKESKWTRISRTAKILISTVSAVVVVAYMVFLLYFIRYRHSKKASASSSFEEGLLHVSFHSLLKATGGFSSTNLLGVGSFGSVYRGLLDQTQSIVAIKILDLTRHGASKSFIAECGALRRIRHRNLVKVLTACSGFDFNGNDFKALVYEYMSNGSLDEWLHPTASQYTARSKLSLLERVNIAIDVACALDYLHHHCETPVVHCDLKPSNVLLDDEMTGHVGDFGLARFLPEATHKLHASQSSSVGVKGSFGYVAPEYGSGCAVSTEGDVYSFGVLVLEMFTGKRPTNDMFENGLNLHRFANTALIDRLENVIDPILLQEYQESEKRRTVTPDGKNKSWFSALECLVSIIEIGVTCSSESPRERMDIGDAVTKLQGIRKKLPEFIVTA